MEGIMTACLAVCIILLMFTIYLVDQVEFLRQMLFRILEKVDVEPPEPLSAMDLMLLKQKNGKKARRFTDKSREFLDVRKNSSGR